MIYIIKAFWKIITKFKDYEPQPITLINFYKWIYQFPKSIRKHLFYIFCKVIYFSKKKTKESLVKLNQEILEKLTDDGVGPEKVIYVSIDRAGSSSPVMLNLLRDATNFERKGAVSIDSKDVDQMHKVTTDLVTGAIIYIDDFSGTGKQFIRSRNWIAKYIAGSFSEFFLAPCICEEAYQEINEASVNPIVDFIHYKHERPLHRDCKLLKDDMKEIIIEQCKKIHPTEGLGFKKLATMVVFYRSAPNTMPLLFRGSLKQNPYKGIFPRHDDLPF